MPLIVHICGVNSLGKFEFFVFGIVRGLLINVVRTPPSMASDANAVCGINWPNTMVAPTNGAVNSQIRAQTIVENAQIFFFSPDTNSVVQVVNMANVDDIAIFDIIAVHINKATRASPLTVATKCVFQ